MKTKRLYIWSIISNIFGIIIGLILANIFDFARFLPMYNNEPFNFSLLFIILIIFWLISLVFYIKGHRLNLNLASAQTVEQYHDNYQLKTNMKNYVAVSLFLILYIFSFIFWMLLYDNNIEYCYFLCTIYEVIIISLIVPFLFSVAVILLLRIFKKKKGFFLK